MDFIFEISVKKPLRKDSLYIWDKFFVGLCYDCRSSRCHANDIKETRVVNLIFNFIV